MEKFKNADILTLISLYRGHECLWKITSSSYRRVDFKEKAYKQIGEVLAVDAEIIKKKIKSLRSTYILEKKKIAKGKKSGNGIEDNYESKLFWFDEMSFIDNTIKLRKTTSNINTM